MDIPTTILGFSTAALALFGFILVLIGKPKQLRLGKTNKTIALIALGAIFLTTGGLAWVSQTTGVNVQSLAGDAVTGDATAQLAGDCANGAGDVTSVTEGGRVLDQANKSAIGYTAQTMYFKRVDTGQLTSATSAAAFGTATLVPCKAYTVKGVNSAGAYSSSDEVPFSTTKTANNHELKGYTIGTLQLRVHDMVNDDYENLFNDATASGTNATAFTTNLNATNVYEDSAATPIAVGAGGKLKEQILLTTTNTKTMGTDPNTPLWFCVSDEGTSSVWDEPVFSFDGIKLANQKGSIDADSATGALVTQAEWCFKSAGKIDDGDHTIAIDATARGSLNPGTSDDLKVSILSEGVYLSSKAQNTLKQGIYTDASTQTLVVYDNTRSPSVTFQVS